MTIEQHFERTHNNPPPPFNEEFCPGFGEALNKAHDQWCEENPNVTRKERAIAYRETSEKLSPLYPSIKEINSK